MKTATTGVLRLALGQREDPSPVIAFSNLGSAISENRGVRLRSGGISESPDIRVEDNQRHPVSSTVVGCTRSPVKTISTTVWRVPAQMTQNTQL